MISLSVEDGLLDLGDALVGDTISSSFKVWKLSITKYPKMSNVPPPPPYMDCYKHRILLWLIGTKHLHK